MDDQEVSSRLARIERELRAWRVSAAVLTIPVILAVGAGAQVLPGNPDYVIARKAFVIRSDDGSQRAILGFDKNGSLEMSLADAKGKKMVSVESGPHDKYRGLVVTDSTRMRTFVGRLDGAFALQTYSATGVQRLALGEAESGEVALIVRDNAGAVRLRAGEALSENNPAITGFFVADKNMKTRIQLMTLGDGSPLVQIRDRSDKARISLGVDDASGDALIWANSADEQQKLSIEVGEAKSIKFQALESKNQSINVLRPR